MKDHTSGTVLRCVVAGWATLAVCTVLTAIQLYLGVGLLQLDETARIWAIVYLCAMGVNGMVSAAAPGFAARMRVFSLEMERTFHFAIPYMPNATWMAATTVVYAAVVIWFLVRRRDAFVRHGGAQL